MAFRGIDLAESAGSSWPILGLFALPWFAHPAQLQVQKAEEGQALQAEFQRLPWEPASGWLQNERMEEGRNQGTSPLTFCPGSSRGSGCLSSMTLAPTGQSCWGSSSPGPWTLDPGLQEQALLPFPPARAWWHPPFFCLIFWPCHHL